MASWSDLPEELVISVAREIHVMEDFIAFGVVCKPWKSAATKQNFTGQLTQQCPLLLTSQPDRTNSITPTCYNLRRGKSLELRLPKTSLKPHYYSSSIGWLMSVSENWEVKLFHPLDHRRQIKLPNLTINKNIRDEERVQLRKFCICSKFALSSSPSWTSDFIVMVNIICLGFAFWRPGGEDEWTIVLDGRHIVDLTYYKGQFYAVSCQADIVVCDVMQTSTKTLAPTIPKLDHVMRIDVLESAGDLLVVLQEENDDGAMDFKVLKVEFVGGGVLQYNEITNLGKRTIFLGHVGSSFAVDAEYSGCEPNCIYFRQELKDGDCRIPCVSRFHMEEKKIAKQDRIHGKYSLWFQPSF